MKSQQGTSRRPELRFVIFNPPIQSLPTPFPVVFTRWNFFMLRLILPGISVARTLATFETWTFEPLLAHSLISTV